MLLTDSFGGGGAERVASLLINGLASNPENKVHVCVFIDTPNYRIDMSHIQFHLLSPRQYPYFLNILNRMKNLILTIKRVRPDVIYSFGPIMASYVILAVKLSGLRRNIKIIASERNDPRREPVSDVKKIVRDYCYNQSDVIVCQTQMAIDLLKERKVNSQFVIIPNPISPNLPSWEGQNSKEIITAARLTEQKNLTMLIDAFNKIHHKFPEYRLTIYGEGEQRSFLQSYVMKKGLETVVCLPGFAKDIHQKMAHAYMYVSSSDYEGISNSMLEALGIGLPCICTDCPVGGARMYIENRISGILTQVGDLNGLYDSMCELIQNKELVNMISEKSREVKDVLNVQKITQKWVNLI